MRVLVLLAALAVGCALEAPVPPQTSVKPVLIVIAPIDFYYQEYADPRQALEEAGLVVKVASITANPEAPATPHDPSWEGDRPTTIDVTPDLALADIDADDYSSLVIAGGWGATTYFYAFTDSPLKGKTVSAPHQRVPDMDYKGVSYDETTTLQMPQFVIDNGGTVVAKDHAGDVNSYLDDVSIDGLILTAQDNYSAYAGGKALALALGKEVP